LYYYAVDKEDHKEEVRSLQIKVDTIPPQIVVIFPQDNSVLNSKTLIVKGVVDVGSMVKVNGDSVTVDGLGNFEASAEVLSSPQIINISATDPAGNSSQKVLTVYLDTTPPNLTVVKPVMFQQVSKLPLIIEGITEKGAKVTVNGDSAEVREDGVFSYSLRTLPEGQFAVIEVIAIDEAGNSTKKTVSVKYSKSIIMKLQVGNKNALINNETYSLEAAPVIKDGRTMVPLRFIGEAFGAEFAYDPVFKIIDINFGSDKIKMQIGKKTAFVNGIEIALDVAPYIVNGRTLVPIRFISETFGAEVVWDGTTKTVTIVYPKQ
ncbi:MAG: stalk domain-containing protein, partial [Bacteroidia bacterium]|nr:stalk domain-containing protein [Bacteroidia bacterium]